MSTARACLLILEAVEPDLLRTGIANGQLPHLAALCENGLQGDINLLPGIGANALWPSLYTGLPPQTHGRFYHQQLGDDDYSTLKSHQTGSSAPPFWAALAAQGHKVVVLDAPKAPPRCGSETCYVSGWRSHFNYREERALYPESLQDELAAAGLQPGDCPCVTQRFTHSTAHDGKAVASRLLDTLAESRDLVLNRMQSCDWDLLVAGLCVGHCAGHQLWHCHDPDYPGHTSGAQGDPLLSVYAALDQAVGDIIARLPADTALLVFAGPGMGPSHVHPALMGELLDALEPAPSRRAGTLRRALTQLWRKLPAGWRKQLLSAGHWADQKLQGADFSNRRCFPVRSNDNIGGLRINLEGREANGRVSPQEYPAYLDHLARQLAGLRNAETGEPLVTRVLKTCEHYPGGERGAMPDLLVEWNERAPVRFVTGSGLTRLAVSHTPQWSGAHNQHAMLVLRGSVTHPPTVPGQLPADSSVLDIAATLSELCGGPAAVGEGRSLVR